MINPKDILSGIKAGPVSTVIGLILFVFGGVMVYSTYKTDHALEWASGEVILFILGAYCLKINDEWISKKFKGE